MGKRWNSSGIETGCWTGNTRSSLLASKNMAGRGKGIWWAGQHSGVHSDMPTPRASIYSYVNVYFQGQECSWCIWVVQYITCTTVLGDDTCSSWYHSSSSYLQAEWVFIIPAISVFLPFPLQGWSLHVWDHAGKLTWLPEGEFGCWEVKNSSFAFLPLRVHRSGGKTNSVICRSQYKIKL